jgi:hypothetical protein
MIISPQRHEGTKVHEVFYYLVRHQDAKEHEVFGLISAAKTTSKETRNRGIQEFDQKTFTLGSNIPGFLRKI